MAQGTGGDLLSCSNLVESQTSLTKLLLWGSMVPHDDKPLLKECRRLPALLSSFISAPRNVTHTLGQQQGDHSARAGPWVGANSGGFS